MSWDDVLPFLNGVTTPGQLVQILMGQFTLFLYVLVRLSGLLTIGPLFGQSAVPGHVRVLLILTLSLLIAPILIDQGPAIGALMDDDNDGVLEPGEIPPRWQPVVDEMLANGYGTSQGHVPAGALRYHTKVPTNVIDLALTVVSEFTIGFSLGFGVYLILSGLQLAGHLIDQQTGIALGEVINPGFDNESSQSGQLLYMLGVTVMLLLEPVNGHLLVVSSLLDTFYAIPVGNLALDVTATDQLVRLAQQSFVLALQVAAPLLATMSLVAVAMGFLGHTVPQINVLVIGFPVRAMISLLLLTISVGGVGNAVAGAIPATINAIHETLIE